MHLTWSTLKGFNKQLEREENGRGIQVAEYYMMDL